MWIFNFVWTEWNDGGVFALIKTDKQFTFIFHGRLNKHARSLTRSLSPLLCLCHQQSLLMGCNGKTLNQRTLHYGVNNWMRCDQRGHASARKKNAVALVNCSNRVNPFWRTHNARPFLIGWFVLHWTGWYVTDDEKGKQIHNYNSLFQRTWFTHNIFAGKVCYMLC